ncbi:MAG: hypothetical protein ACEQSN_02390, partial [Yersinia sp. (in: enterobacteria)]
AIDNGDKDSVENLITIYYDKKSYGKILALHQKYNININYLVTNILENKIKLNDSELKAFRGYDIYNNLDIKKEHLFTFNIFMQIGIWQPALGLVSPQFIIVSHYWVL